MSDITITLYEYIRHVLITEAEKVTKQADISLDKIMKKERPGDDEQTNPV